MKARRKDWPEIREVGGRTTKARRHEEKAFAPRAKVTISLLLCGKCHDSLRTLDATELLQQFLEGFPLLDALARGLFALRLLAGGAQHAFEICRRYDRDADFVRDDDVTGIDDHTAALNGHIDLHVALAPREHGVRAACGYRLREHDEADVAQFVGVAACAVDDRALYAAVLEQAPHETAEYRCLRFPAGVDHDHVTGLCRVQREQGILQVAGGELDRNR